MQGFIARRLLRNVAVAELARRAFSTAARLTPAGLVLLLVLYVPVLALPLAIGLALPSDAAAVEVVGLLGQAAFVTWSIIVTPLAAALLARAAIRSAAGGRLPIREVFAGSGSVLAAAFLPALATGLLTTLGFGFLIIPGFVVGALFFVVGPVAAIERSSFAASFRRSLELTRGNRFSLFGVAFVIGFIESTLTGFAFMFASLTDFVIAALLWFAITLGGVLWRAAASSLAYMDLRTAQENLEVDALANSLGGAPVKADVALSDRDIDALAKRRNVVGRLTGQSIDEGVSIDGMASVREMEAFATRRDRTRRILMIAVCSVVGVGTLFAGAFAGYTRIQENRTLAGYEAAVLAESQRTSSDFDPRGHESVSRLVLEDLYATRPERQHELLGRLMAIHADSFYGPGFAQAFAAYGRDRNSEALLTALTSQIESNGCNPALADAKTDSENRGRVFASACPSTSVSPIDGRRVIDSSGLSERRFKPGLPLGRAVFAELLEIRASGRQIDTHPLHEATLKLLLAGG